MKYQYSYHKLSTYKQCPMKFKFLVDKKYPTTQNEILKVGECFHRFMEKLYTILIKTNQEWNSEKIFNEIQNEGTEVPVIFKAKEIWKFYINYWKKSESYLILDNEHFVEYPISFDNNYKMVEWFDPNAFFRAKIDRLEIIKENNSIRIVDYKTGFTKENDVFQGQIYAWLVSKLYDFTKMKVQFENVRYCSSDVYDVLPSDIPLIQNDIYRLIGKIENDVDFLPCPNDYCSYCDYRTHCPAINSAIDYVKLNEVFDITSIDQAKKAGKFLLLLDVVKKQVTEKLSNWFDNNGDIELEDGKWTKAIIQRKEIDSYEFYKQLIIKGVSQEEVFELLNVDKAKLGYKKNEMKYDIVKDLIEIKEGSASFKYVKK